MKKEDALSLLVYGLMIALAVVVGFTVIRDIFSNIGEGNKNLGLAIGFVLLGIVVNGVLLELGHLIGAKISGYRIMSVNIFGLCLYQKEKHWKFGFKSFNGLTSETKIAPKINVDPNKPNKGKNPKMFSLMPLILYLIMTVALMIVYYVNKDLLNGEHSLDVNIQQLYLNNAIIIFLVTIGGMITIYNYFPAKLDSMTDGYRLTLLSKKENLEAYNELLRIEAAEMDGTPATDIKVFEEITTFTCLINEHTLYKYLKEKNFVEASNLLDKIINNKNKVDADTYNRALANKLFIMFLTNDLEIIKPYYQDKVKENERKYISNQVSMECVRCYMLISSMLEISEHETRYAISHYYRALKKTIPSRVEIEKELYNLALDKVDQVRPEWHIKDKEIK